MTGKEILDILSYYLFIPADWRQQERIKKAQKIVEKSLKALEIIKEKLVDVSLIKKYDFVEDYNSAVWISDRPKLVKEEFNLLKEALE